MSATALRLADAARIMREAVKDRAYTETPLGTIVERYIRWMRNEYGATASTLRDYEAILARMSLTLADRDPIDVSVDDLRAVIDLWASRELRTRSKVTSVIRSFWAWCEEEGHIAISPAARIRRPKPDRKVARVLPVEARPALLEAAKHPRDRVAVFCLLMLGLRKAELSGVQFRDFDQGRGRLRVFGKGRKERVLPLPTPMVPEVAFALVADLPHVGRPPEPDDFLLYPVKRRVAGWLEEGQPRTTFTGNPKKRPSPQAVHRWWYKLAADAGLVGHGTTSGLNMHRARHTFAMELRRVAGIEAASHALGHSDLSTTLGTYGHWDLSDLEAAMGRYGDWLEER